jgi:hypothetical protein
MKTKDQDESKAAPLLVWKVEVVPAGSSSLKIGAVRCAIGAQVRLTQADADKLYAALPGCVVFEGI